MQATRVRNIKWPPETTSFRTTNEDTLYSLLYIHHLLYLGADLIRLHRRATSRFSSLAHVNVNNTTTSTDKDAIFELWLSYAQVQALYGSCAEDARLTFRHVQNQNLGVTKAQYYVKFAEFESQYDVSRAMKILQAGLEQHAEPRQDLLHAIEELKATSETSKQTIRAQESLQSPKLPSLSQSKKRKTETTTSPKRLKKNDGTAKQVLPGIITWKRCSQAL